MRNGTLRGAVVAVVLGLPPLIAASARADIPAGYAGKPFDPAVAGGVGKIPPTVKAGPYPIPGRIDVVNYDLGGVNVAYNSGLHETNHGGNGYRTDTPAPTLCVTSQADKDVWYDTDAGSDGTFYPTATTQDFYVGAVQIGDWFNFTVNVLTAGTYSLSSTWATGNGPPGGEGGDGTMGLQVFVNGTMAATWSAIFPNYETEASYHNWRSYPSFATITLEAGLQVIKLQSTTKHLNLDYVELDLVTPDGGLESSSGSTAGGSGTSGGVGTGAATGGSGSIATSGSLATSGNSASGASTTSGSASPGSETGGSATSTSGNGAAPGRGASSGGGASGASTAASSGALTGSSTGSAEIGEGVGSSSKNASSCNIASTPQHRGAGLVLMLAGMLAAGARRRMRHHKASPAVLVSTDRMRSLSHIAP
jgi:hypothetical protein